MKKNEVNELLIYITIALIAFFYFLDPSPKFYFGDSESYLTTSLNSWMPLDRSWGFGLLVNFILTASKNINTYTLIMLIATVAWCKLYLAVNKINFMAFAGVLFLIDPLILLYSRYYLSDYIALLLFLAWLMYEVNPKTDNHSASCTFLILGCLLMRIAYIPSIAIFLVARIRSIKTRATVLSFVSFFLAVIAISASNYIIAGNNARFTLNYRSSQFLLSSFYQAVKIEDLWNSNLKISPEQFNRFDLDNTNNNLRNLFSDHDSNSLTGYLIQSSNDSGVDIYSKEIEDISKKILYSILMNHPKDLLKLYLSRIISIFTPRDWEYWPLKVDEFGLNREAPASFVDYVNNISHSKIQANLQQSTQPLIVIAKTSLHLYPYLFGLGILCSTLIMLINRKNIRGKLLSIVYFAFILTMPIYSTGFVPRYMLAGIALSYLLIFDFLSLATKLIVSNKDYLKLQLTQSRQRGKALLHEWFIIRISNRKRY